MRRENGLGTVVRLAGTRRRPFAARVTVSYVGGKQIQKNIGYYKSQAEAFAALDTACGSPYDFSVHNATMADIFDKWLKHPQTQTLAGSTLANLVSAYKHCAAVHKTPYRNITAQMMRNCINDCPAVSPKTVIKVLFGHLDNLAYELNVITRKYSTCIKVLGFERQKVVKLFTDAEIARIWELYEAGDVWAGSVLIYLYGGWRACELLELRKVDVDMEAGTMRGGMKTKAGRGRVVPIHSRIRPIVDALMKTEGEFLISVGGAPVSYQVYRRRFEGVMADIDAADAGHTLHDTRHTFISRLDAAGAREVSIQKIVGHKGDNVTRAAYIQKDIEDLKKTIELLT